jgi:hexosaminidase
MLFPVDHPRCYRWSVTRFFMLVSTPVVLRRFCAWLTGRLAASFAARIALPTFVIFAMPTSTLAASTPTADLMPLPAELRFAPGRLDVTGSFRVALEGEGADDRLRAALERMLRRWEERTGGTFPRTPAGGYALAGAGEATLAIECAAASPALPQLGDDESYTLTVTPARATLRAPTTVGAQRGLATLLQLLHSDASGWFVPAVTLNDRPRFPWRGLMIDVGRHWQPVEVIKRNLDGMALVKLNVLHLHLSEDQGFRIESKKYPRLHELGSDGLYFTQDQIREIIAYAAARGIRVVPEFDLPGHAQSWLVGYPELGSAPGPYVLERRWGVFDPVLDPTNEATYTFLEGFLAEMTALFPDPYFHIGGDENNGVQWSANPRIQAFIKEHQLHDNEGLQAYFNRRIQKILAAHGKKLVGWDEILHPDLPKSAIIQSWRGAAGLAAATRAGHSVILSNGYYIDLIQPASQHYLNDPLPADAPLSLEEQVRVLGGEATMWSEWVTPETIDSRIWPRTAAIAERLWSPCDVTDLDDMYRRLAFVSRRLTEAGLLHQVNREPMLRRYAGDRVNDEDLAALRELVAFVQPVQGYQRGKYQPGSTQFTPLTGLADCAAPDSAAARAFAEAADAVATGAASPASLAPFFAAWRELAERVQAAAPATGPRQTELIALARQLADAAALGAELTKELATVTAPGALADDEAVSRRLDDIATPRAAVELPVVAPLRLLAVAIRERPERAHYTPEAWRAHLREIASPNPAS